MLGVILNSKEPYQLDCKSRKLGMSLGWVTGLKMSAMQQNGKPQHSKWVSIHVLLDIVHTLCIMKERVSSPSRKKPSFPEGLAHGTI